MQKYHKIQTMFKRDPETNYKTILLGEWARPEFRHLQDLSWEWTEKIDGTNIRVIWNTPSEVTPGSLEFRGKSDNAQIPPFLSEKLKEMFPEEKFYELYPDMPMCIYGEGYGAKIQKGGGNYIPDGVSFIAFDVCIGETWLERKNVADIADKLNIDIVPIVSYGPLVSAALYAQDGFESSIGSAQAEGLVLRPSVGLLDRMGHRIITKIKHKDFDF